MAHRIDHAAEALRLAAITDRSYGQTEARNGDMAVAQMVEAQMSAVTAQVHATLALVEQERVANLIALARHVGEYDENLDLMRMEAVNALVTWEPHAPDDEHPEIRPDIAAALGIER